MHTPRDRYLALRESARDMRHKPTCAEAALWERLRDHQLGGLHFQRQYVMGKFIVDFYCRAARLVVEVDGEIHRSQMEHDEERDAYLTAQGLRVLRFPNERILNDIYAVLHEIRSAAGGPSPVLRTHPRGADATDPPSKREGAGNTFGLRGGAFHA